MSRKRIENNISYDERNRLYYVTFHYGMDASGKRVKKTKTYDTHIAAAQALRIFEMKKQRQEIVMPTELTVGMWLDRWLARTERALDGLARARRERDGLRRQELGQVRAGLMEMREEWQNWQR